MIRAVVFFCVIAIALGFTRPSGVRSTTQLLAKSKSVPFLDAPKNIDPSVAGYAGFDPVGFTDRWTDKDWSQQVVPDIWPEPVARKPVTTTEWMQEAEIKHGRTAMLAIVGWVAVDLGVRMPGSGAVTGSIANSLAAHNAGVANGTMGVLLLLCFVLELAGGAAIFEQAKGSGRAPGDFGFDPLGFGKNAVALKKYKENEIANGRLAMLAFSGIVTQAAAFPDKVFPYYP